MSDFVVVLLSALSVAMALGVAKSRDNFYSALYMSATLLVVGGTYAYLGVHSVLALIAFIFVGAVGIITIALAASYRFINPVKHSGYWALFSAFVAVFLGTTLAVFSVSLPKFVDAFKEFTADYQTYVLLLVVMVTLLLLSAISMVRRDVE
ncbi:hypothetical protein [Ferroglobus sp.]|uniref:hypothetical protein n=1 Tax=Ferroglobus sp. TaxID=2614230 RepID=UPI0025C43E62|nr:hypothetical protein [Ferroglobus sp.]